MTPGSRLTLDTADYERHAAWLRRLAGGLVRDSTAADDLVQETWVSALHSGPRKGAPLRPWLRGVLINTAHKIYRTSERRERHETQSHHPREPIATPPELAESTELIHALMDEVRSLPAPLRSVILLRYLEGHSAAEIGRASEEAPATIRWRLAEAKKELRERMDRRMGSRSEWAALALPGAASSLGAKGLTSRAAGSKGVGSKGLGWTGERVGLTVVGAAVLAITGGALWIRPRSQGMGAKVTPVTLVATAEPKHAELEPEGTARPSRSPAVASPSEARRQGLSTRLRPRWRRRPEADEIGVALFVTDADGRAIPNARLNWDENATSFAACDQEGWVELFFRPSVTGAAQRFRLQADGFVDEKIQASLRVGYAKWLGNRRMTRSMKRTGTVVDDIGQPIPNARVSLQPPGPDETSWNAHLSRGVAPGWKMLSIDAVVTDSQGRYEFPGAPVSRHQVRAVANGTWSSVSRVLDETSTDPVTLTLKSLPVHEAISGQAVDARGEPLGDILIRLLPNDPSEASKAMEVETDEDGTFSITPNRSLLLQIRAEDLLDRWDNVVIRDLSPGTSNVEIQFTEPL